MLDSCGYERDGIVLKISDHRDRPNPKVDKRHPKIDKIAKSALKEISDVLAEEIFLKDQLILL